MSTIQIAVRMASAAKDPAEDLQFAGIAALNDPATLAGADLLVLPCGSAFPAAAWQAISQYLAAGGNLLVIGGQPLRVPVRLVDGKFLADRPQDTYSKMLGIRHTYEVPVEADARFIWKKGYETPEPIHIAARHFYTLEGRLDGVGYMADSDGLYVAAPMIVMDRRDFRRNGPPTVSNRVVALDFDPQPGFWATKDGTALLARAIVYAIQGPARLSVETEYASVRPGEAPKLSVHLMRQSLPANASGDEVAIALKSETGPVDSATLPVAGLEHMVDLAVPFNRPLPPGFYTITASYLRNHIAREFYENGFWVSPADALNTGPALGARADFLTRGGKTFFPVGTNYFSTEENGWDFSGPRNAAVWEKDFAEMAAHGVSFVRTGVWMSNDRFVDANNAVTERFLRNLEGYLLSAQRHGIAVNFTFFAFSPKSGVKSTRMESPDHPSERPNEPPPPNPYLDPLAVAAEKAYVSSVVARFKSVPYLCWDLINEPSFSNPQKIFAGNVPNNDPFEITTWHEWLQKRYGTLAALAEAWATTPEQLASFDTIPLPIKDLKYDRNTNPQQVRALDYNLFAQEKFHDWVAGMVSTIRSAGSTQLIDVGQDEGGVTDRVLNHFYADAGVAFTTNHTYWQDDSLLWDSVAAKVPGIPNITGETGYQPAWDPDGTWRYDEFTGLGLTERKWALGFAAGTTGAMQWDWARETDFGMQRSDGSARVWENMMRDLGTFAEAAAPHATSLTPPEVAIVLPQSLQLSALNGYALQAQQAAVRALYQYAHAQAYTVGEYQIERLGSPKLILLPSPMGLTDHAWQVIEGHVRAGATLLVTGPFDADAHLHAISEASRLGIYYRTENIGAGDQHLHLPSGDVMLNYSGKAPTVLNQAVLPDGANWKQIALGKGRILFATLPIELNDNLAAIGATYTYALQKAGVASVFTTSSKDPGFLICPTVYPDATLYVLTSETDQTRIAFHDVRSNKDFTGSLPQGRAAIVMIGRDGHILSQYHWNETK